MRVDLEQLAAAAAGIAGHTEELAVRQLSADNRVEAAAAGWVGSSATALSERAAAWAQASAVLLARLGEHVDALRACAAAFDTAERHNTGMLEFPNSPLPAARPPYAGRYDTSTA